MLSHSVFPPQFFLSDDEHVAKQGKESPHSARKLDIVPHSAEGADNTDASSSEWVKSPVFNSASTCLDDCIMHVFARHWNVFTITLIGWDCSGVTGHWGTRCTLPCLRHLEGLLGMIWWTRVGVSSSETHISPVAMDDTRHLTSPSLPRWHLTFVRF